MSSPHADASADRDDERTVLQPKGAARVATMSGEALPPGTWRGEFEITGVLGEGGFGIVYTARDSALQRRVALKEYMPSTLATRDGSSQVHVRGEPHRETFEAGLRSFINEARLLASFDHPSLVKVYRFWEEHGTAYMVMPLYDGVTLKDTLRRSGRPPDEAWLLRLLGPLTEALAAIHEERCFHRDIAPDNILLLTPGERPLLLDFGAARRVIGDMTQSLTVILKPGYAPLEQYAEVPGMKQGPWTDVYALAATVHWMVMGRTPPPPLARLVNDTYQPLVDTAAGRYSAGFLRAIDHALKLRPAERTPDIATLRAELGLPPAGALDATQMGSSAAAQAALRQWQQHAPAAATPTTTDLGLDLDLDAVEPVPAPAARDAAVALDRLPDGGNTPRSGPGRSAFRGRNGLVTAVVVALIVVAVLAYAIARSVHN